MCSCGDELDNYASCMGSCSAGYLSGGSCLADLDSDKNLCNKVGKAAALGLGIIIAIVRV